jgi:DNA-binding CsgD family transcriptional regulator/DNA-binding Lrp family transcriptional regulator
MGSQRTSHRDSLARVRHARSGADPGGVYLDRSTPARLRWVASATAPIGRDACDDSTMPNSRTLVAEAPGVAGLLRDFDALRTWEALRVARAVVTVADLADSTGFSPAVVQRQFDLLQEHGLVQVVRARKPRRSIGYRVAAERIVVVFDDREPASAAQAIEMSDAVAQEFARCLARYADPEFHSKAGVRFRFHTMQRISPEDREELRRRVLSVIEFLTMPRTGPVETKRRKGQALPTPVHCNQAITIRLEPLVGELLPLPSVWMTPRSKIAKVDEGQVARTGLRSLAPREREVALALAEGLSRSHVAERLGLSVHTVSTIARRVYRKLAVTSQAGLAARLAGVSRAEVGER